MERKVIAAPPEAFRTGLLRAAVASALLAAVCGLPGVALLFSPEYGAYLVQKMVNGGITAGSAVVTWRIINTVITVACFVCPAATVGGLVLAIRGNPAKGFGFLADWTHGFLKIVNGAGIVLGCIFVFRAVRYVIGSFGSPQAVMNLYSMVISEGLMGVIAWFLFRNLRKFLDGAGDCWVNLAYTQSTGLIDPVPIPGSAERGFLVLGILCPAWAVSQLVTVTIVVNHIQSYYSLVYASRPAEYLAAVSLVFNGVCCILLSIYLRRYNRICELTKYRARKRT